MDTNQTTPAATLKAFGNDYVYQETFAPGDQQLEQSEAIFKKAGHKIMRKQSKVTPGSIDLYITQKNRF
ncbi:hypothetical protein DYU05_03990 [Mucilaginibacter terrenus]|uniref:Uncharacterized protein n=1 Tax=Mucilaginibacter terrenus TaxID=2482727 RepID=A0A3E2NUT1_9SPHI|nr:hypothetical protein [Mucilaginibacter terrenus]RFZ84776.1 hypothetical protein DYU05_03990 [Mucilaginibacter terrenus]